MDLHPNEFAFGYGQDRNACMAEDELNQVKLQVERDKLTLEERRLELQRRQIQWTAIAVFVPLVIAMGTIAISLITLGRQAELQRASALTAATIQQRQAADQFEMTAAQLVIANNDPDIASSKAFALQRLFPDRFGPDWVERFDRKAFCLPLLEDRMAFARLALEHPADNQRVATLWQLMFCEQASEPFTKWLGMESGASGRD